MNPLISLISILKHLTPLGHGEPGECFGSGLKALTVSSDVEVQDLKNKHTETQEMAVVMVHLCGLFGWIKKHIEH